MNASTTIFLAHASEDKPFVKNLYKALKENGLRPWLDEEDLMPGIKWEDEIPKVIKESKFFIACLSKNSIEKTGYVQKELRVALSTFEQKPPNSIYFIPALIENIELPNISVGTINLSDYQAIKLFKKGGVDKLIQFLKKQVGLVEEIKRYENPVFDAIREEISNGKTDTALRLLMSYVKNSATEYLNNLTLISSRYNRLRDNNILGLISQESYTMESNKVIFSILELIKILEKES